MASTNDAPANELDFFGKVGAAFQMINESWEALKLNIVTFLLVALVPAAVIFVASLFFVFPLIFSSNGSDAASAITGILAFIVFVAAIVVALIFLPALTITQLESVRGKKVTFGEVFERSKEYVLRYIGIALLGGLIAIGPLVLSFLLVFIFIGFLLMPFAYAWALLVGFFLLFAPYILITKNLGVVDSMKASYELTKKHWQWVLALFIVNFVIGLPSIVPFVGWIASLGLGIAYYCLPALIFVNKVSGKSKAIAKEAEVK